MAYDETLAGRVRRLLRDRRDIEEKAMFGGIAFMCRGHMCCGIEKDRLMVRVDPDAYERLLRMPGAGPMDFTGRPMRGFLFVAGAAVATAAALRAWVRRSLEFAESRPAKGSVRTARLKRRRSDGH